MRWFFFVTLFVLGAFPLALLTVGVSGLEAKVFAYTGLENEVPSAPWDLSLPAVLILAACAACIGAAFTLAPWRSRSSLPPVLSTPLSLSLEWAYVVTVVLGAAAVAYWVALITSGGSDAVETGKIFLLAALYGLAGVAVVVWLFFMPKNRTLFVATLGLHLLEGGFLVAVFLMGSSPVAS